MINRRLAIVIASVLVLAACSSPHAPRTNFTDSVGAPEARAMTIYRSPECSCCHLWADIVRKDGWAVASTDKLDIAAFKAKTGVPLEFSSCHTAIVGGYFVEGHVPLEAVERLLAERPDIDGIALPGMPPGSPGMGGVQEAPLEVVAITYGVASPFGSY